MKHHNKDDTIITNNSSKCYTQYIECMSIESPSINKESTTKTITHPYKNKYIENPQK